MIERFQGEAGRRLLIEALLRQPAVQGHREIADAIANHCHLQSLLPGDRLIEQNGTDNDIFFILSGEVTIEVNGRFVAERKGSQHVGEMALIDPVGRRTAAVTAGTETVVAKVTEPDFTLIADAHPRMWRLLATELVERFRQRGAMLKAPNAEPRVFIGSSVEGLAVAEGVHAGLAHFNAIVEPWSQNVFTASAGTMEVLERKAADADFAVLILTPDDVATIRGENETIPRDNVIFELGLFMGALGRHRTYIVKPRGIDLKLPTDLLGVTALEFRPSAPQDLAVSLGAVCTELKTLIRQHGPK
jgi:CRP/FNR family cyclic AMP-dependent transcriptional regulator